MMHLLVGDQRLCRGGAAGDRVTPDPRAIDCEACKPDAFQWSGGNMDLPGFTCSAVEPRDKTMTVVVVDGTTLAYPGDWLINTRRGILVMNPIGKVRSARG